MFGFALLFINECLESDNIIQSLKLLSGFYLVNVDDAVKFL